jgi:hypothetical protein
MSDFSPLICEIFDGLTPVLDGAVYLRHINLRDQKVLADAYERQKTKALKSVPTEKTCLERLKESSLWTDKDELDVEEKKTYIETLSNTKKALELKSQKESTQKTIDAQTLELNKLLNKRRELICTIAPFGKTAEDYAVSYSNEEFIRNVLYADRECRELKYSQEEFDQFDDLSPFMKEYYGLTERMTDEKIQEAVLSDSFSLYLSQVEKPFDFFGRSVVSLSIYQLKMLAYGRMFLNILQNVENIPDSVRKSPKELLDFVESQKKRNKNEGKNSKHSTVGVVGGTREDLDYYDPSAKKIDLAEELKKNGGKMDATQMAKLLSK